MSLPLSENPFGESRLNTGADFRPEWDVPDFNRPITDHLAKQILAVRGRVRPDPSQMIQVLLAPPGYGKTHLFGRVGHFLDEDTLFVFIPAFEDVSKPLEHIRWHVVESLFRERDGPVPPILHRALARLCQNSLVEYVSQFPPSLAARHQALLQALRAAPEAVLGLAQAVKAQGSFQRLAASIASRLPQLPFPVVNALALSWSPLGDVARRWLRGDYLPKEELATLGLPEDAGPPSPLEVLKSLAPLFRYQTPIILCCDQLEMVLKTPRGADQVTAEVLEILHQVPTAVLVLSCLETEWPTFLDKSFMAFRQRVASPQRLNELTEGQAVELVARRIKTWRGFQSQRGPTWPLDEASIISYVRDRSQNPRSLIQRCGELFADWLEGDRKQPLFVTPPKDTLDPAKVFLQRWNAELENLAKDPTLAWSEYQEERLYRAVREVMVLARDAGRGMAGIRMRNVSEDALRQRGQVKRRALAVDLTASEQAYRVIVPVTTLNNGQNFRYYFEDIEHALGDSVAGCLLVHRQSNFQRGGRTEERFEAILGKRLRVFALEENLATLHRLECLLRFLDRAAGQELQIDNVTLSYKDCQDYVLKTSVLDSLDLLRVLTVWRKPEPAKASAVGAAGSKPAHIPEPVATAAAGVNTADGSAAKVTTAEPKPTSSFGESASTATPEVPPRSPEPATNRQAFSAEHEPWAREKLKLLVAKLKLWGLPVAPVGVEIGPAFARLKIDPAGKQTTFNRVRDKTTDLKIQLGLQIAPLIGSQPNHISVDVELPGRRVVRLAEVLAAPPANLAGRPACPVGVDVAGRVEWLDLSDTSDCHLLVAGQTGSGKSEFLRAMLAVLATRLDPGQLQFVLIDPKRVTFNLGGLESPYLLSPIAYEAEQVLPLLETCMGETRRRYAMLAEQRKTNVGQLDDQAVLPRIVIVVDEFADLLTEKETKSALNALLKQIGAIARAAGIHLVLATQRPDKDVVTPLLKANLPGRVAFRVANEANSKLIIGDPGAACLLGKGDLLWPRGGQLLRLQSPFVPQSEMETALRAH